MVFKPGQSGNPNGAKKPRIVSREAAILLKEVDPVTNIERVREILLSLYDAAKAGDVGAANALFDRAEGKVPQAVVGDDEHDAINLKVTEFRRTIVDPRSEDRASVPAAPETKPL